VYNCTVEKIIHDRGQATALQISQGQDPTAERCQTDFGNEYFTRYDACAELIPTRVNSQNCHMLERDSVHTLLAL
jgi:hypothetical protein